MDDNTKIVNQNANQVVPGDQAQPQAQVQPTAPVGSPNKEVGPVGVSVSELASEKEPQINQELAGLKVEAKKDEPNITDEHKEFIDHAKQFTSVQSGPTGKIQLPMSETEIESKLKTGQDDDSIKGLAKLLKKIIKVLGL